MADRDVEFTEKTAMDVRDNFSEVLNRVCFGDEIITVTRHGKPIAVLISVENLRHVEALAESHLDLEEGKAALQEMRKTGEKPLPLELLKVPRKHAGRIWP